MPSSSPSLLRLAKPKNIPSHYIVAALCALLGLAVVMQVQSGQRDDLSQLRETDLVQVLDEANRQLALLDQTIRELEATRRELLSGADAAAAAQKVAEERATAQGILTGRLPAVGPGVVLQISDPDAAVRAHHLISVLQEARNSGTEVVQVNDVRITARSYFLDGPDGIVLDGKVLSAPYTFHLIGDPETITPALSIPGGALAALRNAGASPQVSSSDQVEVTATVTFSELEHARPFQPEESP